VTIGIDLAWSPKNNSGVAVLSEKLELIEYIYADSVDVIMEVVNRYPDAKIGVDAPLIITNSTGHRPNEREFLKSFTRYGLGLHAANLTLFAKRFPEYTGFVLYDALRSADFDFSRENLYEVYPHAIILKLFNDDKVLAYKLNKPKAIWQRGLKRLQESLFAVIDVPESHDADILLLKGKQAKAYEDFLDSLVCAYGVHYCQSSPCQQFGDASSGILLTPS